MTINYIAYIAVARLRRGPKPLALTALNRGDLDPIPTTLIVSRSLETGLYRIHEPNDQR
ncbi:hypothetical protein [Pelagicoccus albus]|uniref:Uncharacterized protein n=1 Tax=Pelagicoccus albus TaxID=415222 RepID=A0A7X1E9V9_9BACT|nr:hypothetical protein [Pelagicoccus albus]MBC2608255.1 hypothetical protein [Pelagicoccus albus]